MDFIADTSLKRFIVKLLMKSGICQALRGLGVKLCLDKLCTKFGIAERFMDFSLHSGLKPSIETFFMKFSIAVHFMDFIVNSGLKMFAGKFHEVGNCRALHERYREFVRAEAVHHEALRLFRRCELVSSPTPTGRFHRDVFHAVGHCRAPQDLRPHVRCFHELWPHGQRAYGI